MRRRIHTSGHSLDASTMTGMVQIQPTMDKIADSPRQNTQSGMPHARFQRKTRKSCVSPSAVLTTVDLT